MKIDKNKFLIIFLILLVPLGLGTKFYSGIGAEWVNNSFSDVLYEIFWSLLLYLFFPRLKILYNVAIVFFTTSGIEFLQLVKTPFLNFLRSKFLGKILLGTTFVPADFFYYAAGCLISYFILTKYDRVAL